MAFTLLKPTGIDLSQTFAFTGSVSGAGGGKILQVQTKILNDNVQQTGSNVSTVIESDAFTLSSTKTE